MIYRIVLLSLLVAGAVTVANASGTAAAPESTTADHGAGGNTASTAPADKVSQDQSQTGAQSGPAKEPDVRGSLSEAAPPAGQPPQMSLAAPSTALTKDDSAYKQELLQQIAAARRNLAKARKQLSGSSESSTLDLAEKLLNMAQARLLDKPTLGPDQAQQEMASALNQAQQRLDVLRRQAGKTSDPDSLNKQIDQAQLRLNQQRQELSTMLATSGSPATGKDQLRQMYAYAQQRLDAARARALTLPNSKETLKALDAAQQRLDAARARFGIGPASSAH